MATLSEEIVYWSRNKLEIPMEVLEDALGQHTDHPMWGDSLSKWFSTLSERDQRVVIHLVEGLSITEISKSINLSRPRTSWVCNRIRNSLREFMNEI